MASVVNDPGGRKRILFVAGDGRRKAVRLGKCSERDAEGVCRHVEALLAAKLNGQPLPRDTAAWLGGDVSATLHKRLARVGLVEPRKGNKTTLQQLVDAYFAHLNVKPITVIGYQAGKAALLDHFGADTALDDISPLQAEQWRAQMKAEGLAEATISKRIGIVKHIFRRGVAWKMLPENPFADAKAGSQINKARQYFIGPEDARKVLDACPDTQWRLLFALSRYGGLRCPSEHLALTWGDVDWEHGRLRVTCSKTEHHEGRGERFCPIFAELRPYLQQAFDEAEPGSLHVITRYRQTNCNLRTQLRRILRKAGLSPWPRLFHNLRSSRQTELTERFPAHVVASWIGNTEKVAQNHYLQTTDAHFAQALQEPPIAGERKAAQNAAQRPPVLCGDASPAGREVAFCGGKRTLATYGDELIAATGVEPVT